MNRLLRQLFPFLDWWPQVSGLTMRADLLAGLTGALVVLPQGVAFAAIAGMPPEYGLYTAMVPVIVSALYGSSWHMVSGPSTAASIVLFTSLGALAEPGSLDYVRLALTLTFMIGAIELVMGMARLGGLANFVSQAVVVGFTAGAAIQIALHQLDKFFGIHMPRGLSVPQMLVEFAQRLVDVQPFAATVGIATLVVGIWARRNWPRLPYMIPALVFGTVLTAVFTRFFYVGHEMPGLGIVGALDMGLPPLSSPDFQLATFRELAPAALAVTLFALTNDTSISRSLAARSGQLVNGNRELLGQGLSNVLGCFFSAYVATGSINRSALNYEVGARTPLAAVSSGVLLMGLVLFVEPLLAWLPDAAMAAVLFMVAWGLVDFRRINRVVRTSRAESVVMWSTFAATLLLDLEFAILLGVMLSLVVYLNTAAHPRVMVRMPDPRTPERKFTTDGQLAECPQAKFVRIDGALFFGAVNYVAGRLRVMSRHNPGQRHLVLFARTLSFVDVAGAEMLASEARERRRDGGALWIHQLREDTRETLERGGYLDDIGGANLYESKQKLISDLFSRLDRGICVRCDKRVFRECADVPRVEISAQPAAADDRGAEGK